MSNSSNARNFAIAATNDPQELEIAQCVSDCVNNGQIGSLSRELNDGRSVTFTVGLYQKYGVPELVMTGVHDIEAILKEIVKRTYTAAGEWRDTLFMVADKPVLVTLLSKKGALDISFLNHMWGGPIPVRQCLWTNLTCTFADLDIDGRQFVL